MSQPLTITFDVFDLEIATILSPRHSINEAIASRLQELGHQLPADLLERMKPMTDHDNLRAWHDTFRALGYVRLDSRRDEENQCHRFTLHPAHHHAMKIRIDKCTSPSAWYRDRIGQILPVSRFEKNRHPSQGIPEDVYWCREGGLYNCLNYVRASDARETITLHLVLTRHWYDETTKAIDPKRTEYREVTPRWRKLIYDRREIITGVRFARAYTATMAEFAVTHIDIGPCLIPGHEGERIRIHFTDLPA